MTKYEWERELKRHIAVLPKNEQARIFDYYSEIFEDRIEAGMQEKDIIYEFGNPFDVAQKILSDYRYEDYETVRPPRFRPDRPERDEKKAEPVFESESAAPAYTAPKEAPRQTADFSQSAPREEKSSSGKFGRFLFMLVLYLFLGIPVIAVILSLAAIGLALAFSCIAMMAGGLVYAVYWAVQIGIAGYAASTLALIGTGLAVAGLGFIFVAPCFKLTKIILVSVGKIFRATFRYIRGKKAVKA